MKTKCFLWCGIGFLLGALVSGISAYVFAGRQTAELLKLNQEIEIGEWEHLSWEAYTNKQPEVAAWVLSNYLNKIGQIYDTRPEKDKAYYFLMFKGQARLMQIYGKLHDDKSETNELNLAISSMQQWSSQAQSNEEAVLNLIGKIDAKEQNE